jgi:hypothetical protein
MLSVRSSPFLHHCKGRACAATLLLSFFLEEGRGEVGWYVYEAEWNASNYASGVYFYRIQAGDFVASKKLLLLK